MSTPFSPLLLARPRPATSPASFAPPSPAGRRIGYLPPTVPQYFRDFHRDALDRSDPQAHAPAPAQMQNPAPLGEVTPPPPSPAPQWHPPQRLAPLPQDTAPPLPPLPHVGPSPSPQPSAQPLSLPQVTAQQWQPPQEPARPVALAPVQRTLQYDPRVDGADPAAASLLRHAPGLTPQPPARPTAPPRSAEDAFHLLAMTVHPPRLTPSPVPSPQPTAPPYMPPAAPSAKETPHYLPNPDVEQARAQDEAERRATDAGRAQWSALGGGIMPPATSAPSPTPTHRTAAAQQALVQQRAETAARHQEALAELQGHVSRRETETQARQREIEARRQRGETTDAAASLEMQLHRQAYANRHAGEEVRADQALNRALDEYGAGRLSAQQLNELYAAAGAKVSGVQHYQRRQERQEKGEKVTVKLRDFMPLPPPKLPPPTAEDTEPAPESLERRAYDPKKRQWLTTSTQEEANALNDTFETMHQVDRDRLFRDSAKRVGVSGGRQKLLEPLLEDFPTYPGKGDNQDARWHSAMLARVMEGMDNTLRHAQHAENQANAPRLTVPFYSFVEKGLEGASMEEQQLAYAQGVALMLDYLSMGTLGLVTKPARVAEVMAKTEPLTGAMLKAKLPTGVMSKAKPLAKAVPHPAGPGRPLYAYSRRPFLESILKPGTGQGRVWASHHPPADWAFDPGWRNMLQRALKTGRLRKWNYVKKIPEEAAQKFTKVRAIGPFRGWKRRGGQYYTTKPGELDMTTGEIKNTKLLGPMWRAWDGAFSHGFDAAIDVSVPGIPGYLGYRYYTESKP